MRTGSPGELPSSMVTLPLIRMARGASPGKFPGELLLPVGLVVPPMLPGLPVGDAIPPVEVPPRPWADNCATVRIIAAAAPKIRENFMIHAPAAPIILFENCRRTGFFE